MSLYSEGLLTDKEYKTVMTRILKKNIQGKSDEGG